jgi:hypothetical protein
MSTYVDVADMNGVYQTGTTFYGGPFEPNSEYMYCLEKGIYKMSFSVSASYYYACPPDGYSSQPCNNNMVPFDTYTISFSNSNITNYQDATTQNGCTALTPISGSSDMMNPTLNVPVGKKMLFSAWVKDGCTAAVNNCSKVDILYNQFYTAATCKPAGPVIDGWQRVEGEFTLPADATSMSVSLVNNTGNLIYFDDIRIQPYNGNMKSYVYDPVSLRLVAQLDENNYASFYEYDEQGTLIRTKAETEQGIKTIQETRSAKQKSINTFQ